MFQGYQAGREAVSLRRLRHQRSRLISLRSQTTCAEVIHDYDSVPIIESQLAEVTS